MATTFMQVLAIRMADGETHPGGIRKLRCCLNGAEGPGESFEITKDVIVAILEDEENDWGVYVRQGDSYSVVALVDQNNGVPYLRTYADNEYSDNLLSLPRF